MKSCVAIFFFLCSIVAQAQTSLAEARLSLTDKQSEIVLGKAVNELSEMLINAFKQGKLKAYRFGFQKQPIYGEIKQWPNPINWNASVKYDRNDSVLYKGKLYRYRFKRNEPEVIQLGAHTPDIAPDAHGINDYWMEYIRVPPVVGMKYSLPDVKDLMKGEEWDDVKSKALPPMSEWRQDNYNYYIGDRVSYKGKTYEAIRNNVNSNPTNQDNWIVANYDLQDDAFTELQFVYNNENRLPIAFQLSLSSSGKTGIGFFMKDVQKYLIEAKQEVLASKLEGLMREMCR